MADRQIYQFRVMLQGIKPAIWRQFQVASDVTFYGLHEILQMVMGWDNAHLHSFRVGKLWVTDAETLAETGQSGVDETGARLEEYVQTEGEKFLYEYDFGDSWLHEVTLEQIVAAEEGVAYPRCLAGKRACPPEDCGGVWGYQAMLAALADKSHPDYRMYRQWVGSRFNAEKFDVSQVNKALAGYGA